MVLVFNYLYFGGIFFFFIWSLVTQLFTCLLAYIPTWETELSCNRLTLYLKMSGVLSRNIRYLIFTVPNVHSCRHIQTILLKCRFAKGRHQNIYTGSLKKTPEFSCIRRNVVTFEPCNGFTNCFLLLKTEIHTQILNTESILYDFRQPRYLPNKMGLL